MKLHEIKVVHTAYVRAETSQDALDKWWAERHGTSKFYKVGQVDYVSTETDTGQLTKRARDKPARPGPLAELEEVLEASIWFQRTSAVGSEDKERAYQQVLDYIRVMTE